ncbi:MAG: hypothetical protein HFH12_02770 [Dorea sp.]|nr:hypothetical protein [Dorea sp.]
MNTETMVKERILKAVKLANEDSEGKKLAAKLGDGKLVVKVARGLSVSILVKEGNLEVVESDGRPKAVYEFSDVETAWALMNKRLSPYVATVHRKLNQQGLSPMNDTFEDLLLLAYERERKSDGKKEE